MMETVFGTIPDPIFRYKSLLGHYNAEAFIVRCLDFRFEKAFEAFIEYLNIKYYDPESPAGGAKVLAYPEKESDRDFILRDLAKSIKLHRTQSVKIFTHHDCGACGGFEAFENNYEKEFAYHKNDLHPKARKAIWAQFPDMQVESYFITEEGIIKI